MLCHCEGIAAEAGGKNTLTGTAFAKCVCSMKEELFHEQ